MSPEWKVLNSLAELSEMHITILELKETIDKLATRMKKKDKEIHNVLVRLKALEMSDIFNTTNKQSTNKRSRRNPEEAVVIRRRVDPLIIRYSPKTSRENSLS